MNRIKIELPGSFHFTTQIPVRITDVNYGGHVGNDTILSLIHEARVQFFKSIGYAELQFAGTSLIMSDIAIEFKSELFHGDVVKAYVATGEIGRVGFDVYYKLVNSADESIVAFAKTGMVCYNYENKKVVSVPEEAKAKLI